jgi:hypothetical protein
VSPGVPVAASHIQELRNALGAARQQLQLPAVVYSRNQITSGMLIMAADVTETRGGVR